MNIVKINIREKNEERKKKHCSLFLEPVTLDFSFTQILFYWK